MPRLELAFLGPFRAALDGRPLTSFRSVKTQALLAYLVLESDQAHSRELLASLLWPEEPDRTARRNLRQTLYYLRQALTDGDGRELPLLISTAQTIEFGARGDCWLDVAEFLACLETDRLETAADLYRGDLLSGLFVRDSITFEEWMLVTRERLHRLALDALHLLTQQRLERGDYPAAQESALRQLTLEPWSEEAHRQLMQVLALRGQRSAALGQYEKCCRVLAEEMGIDPAAETAALYEHIRDGVWPAVEAAEPPQPGGAALHNFPPQPTSFVGREQELADLLERLADPDCRLLTLTGMGGIGKTRLAAQSASLAAQASRFVQGIVFVPCAGIPSPPPDAAPEGLEQTYASAIAAALGLALTEDASPKEQLLGYLRGRRLLLVLDNLEHLPRCAFLVGKLLAGAPNVKVLATSREPLLLHEEQLYPLEGLDVPPSGVDLEIDAYSSVRLFVQQARRVQPRFALDAANRPDVARICRFVAGVPLGIELAASWLRGLTCAEIAAEMGRLDFFATPLRNVPARHQSMRAVFEHSWQLLTPQQQLALAQLAVFRGGFRLEAAQAVAGTTLMDLTTLVARSLVQRTPAGRYTMHELLRQFAAEKLAALPETKSSARAAHGLYYLGFLATREQALLGQAGSETVRSDGFSHPRATEVATTNGSWQLQAMAECEGEVDNLRQAWLWATADPSGCQAERLAALRGALKSLYLFYRRHHWYAAGEVAFGRAAASLEQFSGDGPWLAQALAAQALCAAHNTKREHARDLMLRSEALLQAANNQSGSAFTFLALASAAYWLQAYAEGVGLLQRCLAVSAPDERWVQAEAYHLWAVIDNKRGAFADAWPKMQTCLAFQRQLDDPPSLAAALSMLGYVGAFLRKREAVDYLRESLARYQALNDLSGMASALVYLSTILVHQGLYAQAEENCRQSLHLSRQTADDSTHCLSLSNLCLVLVGQGKYDEILELSAEGLALDGGGQDLRCSLMGSRAYAQVKLGVDEALAQPDLQAALALAQQIRYPLAMFLPLCGLGELAWRRGEYDASWQCYRQALSAARTMGATFFTLGALTWLARLRAEMGEPRQALAWLALVVQHPVTTPTERQIAEQAWQQIADKLTREEVAEAKAQGEALDLGQLVAELLEPQQVAEGQARDES